LPSSLPSIVKALQRRKVTPKGALLGHKLAKQDLDGVKRIYQHVGDQGERFELNLYVVGEEEDQ
jgi:succinate dehydrogenase / fumarate reductase, iron-sulfur subunit